MARPVEAKARLVWLLDGEVCFGAAGPNRHAADRLVAHLAEKLTDDLVAASTAFVMLAEAVDADPTNAALWREYRQAETGMRVVTSGDDDAFGQLLAELAADLPDPPKRKPANPRSADRKGKPSTRAAADAPPAARRRRSGGTTT